MTSRTSAPEPRYVAASPGPASAIAPTAQAPIAVPLSKDAFHVALAVLARAGPARPSAATSVRFCTLP
jgi:hypothetical protein